MYKIIWSGRSWEEYTSWQTEDKKTLRRINELIKDIEQNGCLDGKGKPEALKYRLSGWYSRHIDEVNRLVYRIREYDGEKALEISQCKDHYND